MVQIYILVLNIYLCIYIEEQHFLTSLLLFFLKKLEDEAITQFGLHNLRLSNSFNNLILIDFLSKFYFYSHAIERMP